jgi:hypothetical protein
LLGALRLPALLLTQLLLALGFFCQRRLVQLFLAIAIFFNLRLLEALLFLALFFLGQGNVYFGARGWFWRRWRGFGRYG